MNGLLLQWERGRPSEAQQVIALRSYYEFLAERLFHEYEPTKHAMGNARRNFLRRLEAWLSGFDDKAHAMTAFKSIQYVFFAGTEEYEELYRCAYDEHISRWLMKQQSISLFDEDVEAKVGRELRKTWICPATDSLRINGFLHVNGIRGHDVRTDWRALSVLGDDAEISDYVRQRRIARLVIVDDFVGGGTQFWGALSYAMKVFPGEILAVPLICCASGMRSLKRNLLATGRENVTLSPVLTVPDNCMVGEYEIDGEPKLFTKLRRAMKFGYEKMGVNVNGDEYGSGRLGSLTILYSNCPNNTPPIYGLDAGGRWNPIFRRISR